MIDNTKPTPTLYKKQKDLIIAATSLVECIKHPKIEIPVDNEGFLPVKFVTDLVRLKNTQLTYINWSHIVEFFFKDLAREILFKGENLIKISTFKDVEEQEILVKGEPLATLYNNPTDLSSALITSVHLLKNNTPPVECDENGYCKIENLVEALKKRMPFLSYINRNHIVELFFKDKHRKIMLKNGYLIKYKKLIKTNPPDILYFGTLQNLSKKMKSKGIFSHTKRYIKLYTKPEKATEFALKFANHRNDRVVALPINAKLALDKGCKILCHEPGEFTMSSIDKEFIL